MSSPAPPQPEPPSAANGPASHDATRTTAQAQARRRQKPGKAGKVRPAPDIASCNWVSVRRAATDEEAVTGRYLLDPTLDVAPELLSPTVSGGIGDERPALEVRNPGGNIDIDVWISHVWRGVRSVRESVLIYLEGRRVTLRLHSLAMRVVHLVIDATELSVDLPPEFRGAFHANTPRSRMYFSRDLLQKLVVNDDGPQSMTGVIGDYSNARDLSNASVLSLRSPDAYINLRSLKENFSMQQSLSKLFKRKPAPRLELDDGECRVQ